MEVTVRSKVRGTPGCELLRAISPVDPRAAEGLRRQPVPGAMPATSKEMEALLEEEKRLSITDPYQRLLFEVKALQKKGNFRASQGDVIVQRVRDLSTAGCVTLDLSGFTIFDAFVELLAPFLQSQTCKLAHVSLVGTQIGSQGAVAIAKSLNSALETLQFSSKPLDVSQFRQDASNRTKKDVVLGRSQFNHLDATVVGTLIERVRREVETVDLAGNLLTGPKANVFHGVGIILQSLKRCSQLRRLKLDDIGLRSDGLVDLANTIQDLPRLEVLELSGNKLAFNSSGDKRSTGIEAFCNALWQAPRLVDLSLADNHLDYASATFLADMLAVNVKLKRVDLSGNPLSNAGIVLLSTGLKKNASLEHLKSGLGDEGLQALCSVLRRFNRTLLVLDVRENIETTSSGYRGVVKCLTTNAVLREVLTSPSQRHLKFAKRTEELLQVNVIFSALNTGDKKAIEVVKLTEAQATNLIQKMHQFSEADLERFNASQLLRVIVTAIDRAVGGDKHSSIAHYAETEQLASLKKLLWMVESNNRQEARGQRLKSGSQLRPDSRCSDGQEDPDDDDVWDYPLY